ncbi:MAG: 3-hydroxyisobutyrate dehydrogenase [Pseudomonadota bacterium]
MERASVRIGFIGLGQMGLPMARNLASCGHDVRAYDVSREARERGAAAGLTIADTALDAAEGAKALITMLPMGQHVLSVYQHEVLSALSDTAIAIDCSSIDMASAEIAHARAAEAGLAAVDAPVSGGIMGADAASLTFMVGGAAAAFQTAEPILACMGRKIIHCGDAGAGQGVKMCNQMMVAANVAVVAEAFVLAEHMGLDPKVVYDVVIGSSGNSWALENYCPVPGLSPMSAADRGFSPGFTTELMLKDLGIFQGAARVAGTATPVGTAATEVYRLMRDAGYESHDYSAIIEFLRGKRPPSTAEGA